MIDHGFVLAGMAHRKRVAGKGNTASKGFMKARNRCAVALCLVDVVNHFEFPRGDSLLRQALRAAPNIAELKDHARAVGIPSIYVNDNFGKWRSDAKKVLAYCMRDGAKGLKFVTQLRPDDQDYLILKPKHSGFYQTPLEMLLQYLGASRLILAGLATNSCIMATAYDAAMRNMEVFVPRDCCAAASIREHKESIRLIQAISSVDVTPSKKLKLARIARVRR